MKKEQTKQKNFRLPESLVKDLELVSGEVADTQTDIVVSGIRARVNRLKKRIEDRRERAEVTA